MINVWVPISLILSKYRPVPLLMHTSSDDSKPELAFWNLLRRKLDKNVTVHYFDNLDEAGSLVVAPNILHDYYLEGRLEEAYQFSSEVRKTGRKIILFAGGAVEHKPKNREIVFAVSTYNFKDETSIPIPNWLYGLGDEVSSIDKPIYPTLGFVGNVAYPGRLSNFFGSLPIPDKIVYSMAESHVFNRSFGLRMRRPLARLLRQSVIKKIENLSQIETKFLARNADFFNASRHDKERSRKEFIQNIQNNAYQLCVRGDDNSSYRLYEVISSGRIPVIIDTNFLLPKLKSLRWEDFSIIVSCNNLDKIGEIIRDFHNGLSDKDFEQICLKSKLAFEELLPHNYLLDTLKKYL